MYASYAVHLTTASQSLVNKFKRNAPPPVNRFRPILPTYIHDIFEKIDIDNNVQKHEGPQAILDIQLDYRLPLLSIESLVIQLYKDLDPKSSSILSLPSLTAYCLALLYGLALINDSTALRRQQSEFAREFCENPKRNELYVALTRACVPQFMHSMLDSLQGCYLLSKTRILAINTLACADYSIDFGRIFPCSIFLTAHHLIATQPTNQHPSVTQHIWLTSQITSGTHSTNVAHYFAQHLDHHNTHNWLFNTTQTMFNTTLNRFHTVRPTMQRIVTFPIPTPASAHDINPYIYALFASPDNVATITSFIRNMSACLTSQQAGTHILSEYTKIEKHQTSLINHYYTTPGTPTWHYLRAQPPSKVEQAYPPEIYTADQAAKALNFLANPKIKASVNVVSLDCADRVPPWLYLGPCRDENVNANVTRTVIRHLFDSDNDVLPNVRHMCPVTPSPDEMRMSLILGKAIESFEIDGFSTRQPDPENSIQVENGSFLESAIPLAYCHAATAAYDQTFVAAREEHSDQNQPVQIDMLKLDQNRMPIIGQHIYGAPEDQEITGFVRDISITDPLYASSNPSYVIVDHDSNSPIHTNGTKKFFAWSCIRHYNTHQHQDVPRINKTYMLMNMRLNFGTNVLLSETPHLADIMTVQ